jgi:hypothetical protein
MRPDKPKVFQTWEAAPPATCLIGAMDRRRTMNAILIYVGFLK